MNRVIVFTLALSALSLAAARPVSAEPVVRIVEFSGRVEFRPVGEAWQRVRVGQELPLGGTISTGFGARAAVEVGNSVLEVEQLTRMRIDELLRAEGIERSRLHLEVGRVRANVRAVEDVQPDFELSSPVSTAAVRGTSFSFDGFTLRVENPGRVLLLNRFGRWITVGPGEKSRSDGTDDGTKPSGEAEKTASTDPYVPGADPRPTGAERIIRQKTTGTLIIEWVIEVEEPPL